MGALVSALAFPAPALPKRFYKERLLRRGDLVFLRTTHDERIPACYVKSPVRQGLPGCGLTILYSHGNAEDLALHLPFVEALAKLTGADVLTYEYVGYSLSRFESPRGVPSEEACYRSIDAAWRYLTHTQKVPATRIVVYGRSLGSGPSVDLVARHHVAGSPASPRAARAVFLQSPLESAIRSALGDVAASAMYSIDIFRNYEKIAKVAAPCAIVHGIDDKVVPCAGAKALHAAVPRPFEPRWLDDCGHNDMPCAEVFAYLRDFLAASASSNIATVAVAAPGPNVAAAAAAKVSKSSINGNAAATPASSSLGGEAPASEECVQGAPLPN